MQDHCLVVGYHNRLMNSWKKNYMKKYSMEKVVVICAVGFLSACSSFVSNNPNYQVIAEINLSSELKETSGLYCPKQGVAYTINDSGNAPIIYRLDENGKIQDKLQLNVKNQDWEAINGDDQYYYIGDIGNNSGKRQFVKIHTVAKGKSPQVSKTLQVTYTNNPIDQHNYQGHDFDAEALVSVEDKLYLFSKSWLTGTLSVYEISKEKLEQTVAPFTEIKGLPGMVTGSDYDSLNQRFILAGYALKGVGRLYPFITIVDNQFKMAKSFPLDNYNQVEGVCATPSGEIWITQESSFLSGQKLVKLKLK